MKLLVRRLNDVVDVTSPVILEGFGYQRKEAGTGPSESRDQPRLLGGAQL